MVPELRSAPSGAARPAHNVTNILRERIQSGRYRAGEWLPAERELTQDLHVHRRVVRTAIDELVREGLISRKPNCRPIVAAETAKTPAASSGTASASALSPSKFVALVMWHGGPLEQGGTAQQRIFWGMNTALGQAGYHGLFLDLGESIGTEEENAEREAAHLRYAVEQGFGGIVFYAYAYQYNRDLIHEVSQRVPLCLIDRMLPGVTGDFVGVQNYEGMFEATTHLIEQGHRRIAYVTKSEPINPVQDRLKGYLYAMNAAFGVDADEIVLTAPAFNGGAWTLFDTVFSQPIEKRPTAVVAFNDYEAARVLRRLTEMHLRVPEDVALVGFDDIVRALPNGIGLTSVAQPFEELGKAAANVLVQRLSAPGMPPAHIELPPRLVVRASSGGGS